MPFLSPAKLIVILVVAIIVLGPEKLPTMARQVGSLWGDFRRFRQRFEEDVRGNFPDLPSTERITEAVRSPLAFLDSLADAHSPENATSGSVSTEPSGSTGVVFSEPSSSAVGTVTATEESTLPDVVIGDPQGVVHQVRSVGSVLPDDPSLN